MKYFTQILFGIILSFISTHLIAAIPIVKPAAPNINARGYLLMDYYSGRLLAEKNVHERMEPASLTKMMTAYVVAHELKEGHIKLDDMVEISKKAWRMPGSRMFVEVGKKVSVKDLLKGVIVQSGNDATVALAEHVAGSEKAFVSLMNQYAEALGMLSTHFANSTGLPNKNHYSTPWDLAILARALIMTYPDHYNWYSEKSFTFNGITQYNRNKLLWRSKYVDGIKTGHTDSAGYCLVASARREDMRLISVVLGTKSENARAEESQTLLTYGFRFFETHLLYAANETMTEVPVWKGEEEKLSLGIQNDLFVTIPRGQYKNLTASVNVDAKIMAPVQKGKQLGTLNIKFGDETFAERELVALDSVAEGSLLHSLVDDVRLMFQ